MDDDTLHLAALISSRICHDLISPIGAVANGLEMLELSGTPRSPELDLVAQSVANANARIRLFRLAFGTAQGDQMVASDEVRAILADVYSDGRVLALWAAEGAHPRPLVRAALLGLLCVEQAAPFGGQLTVTEQNGGWTISAISDRLSIDQDVWALLHTGSDLSGTPPAKVQFAALGPALLRMDRSCAVQITESMAEIRF